MQPRLSQTQSQKLILAPQLRQFLKLLELPIFELEGKIEQELEQNPALEEAQTQDETAQLENPLETDIKTETQVQDVLEQLDSYDKFNDFQHANDDFSDTDQNENQKRRDYQESILTKSNTLQEYLDWQVGFLDLTKKEKVIAEHIIGNIDDDGKLTATIDEIAKASHSSIEETGKILSQIQTLDPPGVGGRDIKEILLLQLRRQKEDTSLAERIVSEHLSLLERKQFDQLARNLNVSVQKIKDTCLIIGRLEPKPGRIFYLEKPNFVVPDAIVSISEDHENALTVEMTNDRIPRLRINAAYREMLKQKNLDPQTKTFLKEKIQAGLDLIRAVAQRKSTILQITEEITKLQHDFFTKGFSQLKPLRLKDVAEKIGIHESTVSRAIQGKYLDTPQGTIPYKSFFSSKLGSDNGSSESQKSVTERVKHLIAEENKQKPLSDAQIVKLLDQEGIKVARRTVAKYRDLLKILPAYLRKG